mgnify:CR=1 FL=1
MDEVLVLKIINESVCFISRFIDLPEDISITIENYDPIVFGNEYVSAVTTLRDNHIKFNRLWISNGKEEYLADELRFFTFHELRHIYQWHEFQKLTNGEDVAEKAETIILWHDEFLGYKTNYGDDVSLKQNVTQEIELDANGYAYILLWLFHFGEAGAFSPVLRLLDDVFRKTEERALEYKKLPEIDQYISVRAKQKHQMQRKTPKPGRNDPCPCGSGKKFKKCCIDKGIYD